jgi:hypothetical protein
MIYGVFGAFLKSKKFTKKILVAIPMLYEGAGFLQEYTDSFFNNRIGPVFAFSATTGAKKSLKK